MQLQANIDLFGNSKGENNEIVRRKIMPEIIDAIVLNNFFTTFEDCIIPLPSILVRSSAVHSDFLYSILQLPASLMLIE